MRMSSDRDATFDHWVIATHARPSLFVLGDSIPTSGARLTDEPDEARRFGCFDDAVRCFLRKDLSSTVFRIVPA